jgi:hypothetical protein
LPRILDQVPTPKPELHKLAIAVQVVVRGHFEQAIVAVPHFSIPQLLLIIVLIVKLQLLQLAVIARRLAAVAEV